MTARGDSNANRPQPDKVHGSLLAQTMTTVPGHLSNLVFNSLAQLGKPLSLTAAWDLIASRALQVALRSEHTSVNFRRKMI